MKNRKFSILVLCSMAVIGLAACKKDKDEPSNGGGGATLTPEQLIARTWKVTSIKENGIEKIEECDKDDRYTVAADGKVTIRFGSLVCDTMEYKDTTITDMLRLSFINGGRNMVSTVTLKMNIPGVGDTTFVSRDTSEVLELTTTRFRGRNIEINGTKRDTSDFTWEVAN